MRCGLIWSGVTRRRRRIRSSPRSRRGPPSPAGAGAFTCRSRRPERRWAGSRRGPPSPPSTTSPSPPRPWKTSISLWAAAPAIWSGRDRVASRRRRSGLAARSTADLPPGVRAPTAWARRRPLDRRVGGDGDRLSPAAGPRPGRPGAAAVRGRVPVDRAAAAPAGGRRPQQRDDRPAGGGRCDGAGRRFRRAEPARPALRGDAGLGSAGLLPDASRSRRAPSCSGRRPPTRRSPCPGTDRHRRDRRAGLRAADWAGSGCWSRSSC